MVGGHRRDDTGSLMQIIAVHRTVYMRASLTDSNVFLLIVYGL